MEQVPWNLTFKWTQIYFNGELKKTWSGTLNWVYEDWNLSPGTYNIKIINNQNGEVQIDNVQIIPNEYIGSKAENN